MTVVSREDHQAVLSVWDNYRNGIYDGDADRLARLFHPSACMFFVLGEELVATPIKKYIEAVRDRAAPRSVAAPRNERFVSLAMPAIDSAVLTATILIMGKHYTDQLTMMKSANGWVIISKTYHLDYDNS